MPVTLRPLTDDELKLLKGQRLVSEYFSLASAYLFGGLALVGIGFVVLSIVWGLLG